MNMGVFILNLVAPRLWGGIRGLLMADCGECEHCTGSQSWLDQVTGVGLDRAMRSQVGKAADGKQCVALVRPLPPPPHHNAAGFTSIRCQSVGTGNVARRRALGALRMPTGRAVPSRNVPALEDSGSASGLVWRVLNVGGFLRNPYRPISEKSVDTGRPFNLQSWDRYDLQRDCLQKRLLLF